MPIQKPERDEWMRVNDRQTEQFRRQPIERAQSECDWQNPKPIAIRFLPGPHQDERAEPQNHRRVPYGNCVRPIGARPNIGVVERGKRNIRERQQPDSRKRHDEEVSRAAKARRQTHQEITRFEPIVRPGKQKYCHDRHLQRQPTRHRRGDDRAANQNRRESFRGDTHSLTRSCARPRGDRNVFSSLHIRMRTHFCLRSAGILPAFTHPLPQVVLTYSSSGRF